MSTAHLATLRAVFTDGSTPVVSRPAKQPLELAQYTAGHIFIECVNEDGSAHSLAYDTLLLGVRLHPTDAAPAILLQASNLDEDPDGNPADNWGKFELVPGHWVGVPPRIYGYDVVAVVGGEPDDSLPVVPHGQWKTTAEAVHPGDQVQVPVEADPLAQGPQGPAGADGADGADGATGPQGPPGTISNPHVANFFDGAYTHAVQLGAVLDGTFLFISPGDTNPYSSFRMTYASTPNVSGPNDNVFGAQHNMGPGGEQIIAGRGGIGYRSESRFLAAHEQGEAHIAGIDNDANETRFLSAEMHYDDGTSALWLASTVGRIITGRNSEGTALLAWGVAGIDLFSGSGLNYVSLTNDLLQIHFGSSATIDLTTNSAAIVAGTGVVGKITWDANGIDVTGRGNFTAGIGLYGTITPFQQTLPASPTVEQIRALLVAYGLCAA